MNLTTVVPSQQTIKDLALLAWFALLPFAVYLPGGLDRIFDGVPVEMTTFEAVWLMALFNSVPAWFLLTSGHYFDRWIRIATFCLMSLLTILVHAGNDPLSDPEARLRFLLAPVHITLVGAFLILLWTNGLEWLERRRERLL